MNERDGVRPKLEPPRGVLYGRAPASAPGYARFWPAAVLAPFIEHFWTVCWDLAEPEVFEVLPHPSVHLVLEAGRSRLVGVPRGRFTRRLEGRGRVLGTKFHPGGFRPFFGRSVATLHGRELPLVEVFGTAASELESAALGEEAVAEAFGRVQEFLCARLPPADPDAALARAITAHAAADREIRRVDELARAHGLAVRRLQRLFAEYVGVSPKWVIQRYRLHEAAERLARGEAVDGASLAHELGYADQAHLVRDFRRLVGKPPGAYARSLPPA